ncbi:MAG: hypothetical protein DCC75_01655 [Proteobacteria bacterium]|nr:MAG: hypothetical protein DCC75_01655 [Pseudomonadota bacterium]
MNPLYISIMRTTFCALLRIYLPATLVCTYGYAEGTFGDQFKILLRGKSGKYSPLVCIDLTAPTPALKSLRRINRKREIIKVSPIRKTDRKAIGARKLKKLKRRCAQLSQEPRSGDSHGGDPSDTDGDGLPDVWEIEMFGSLTQTGSDDPDNDGWTNLQEHQLGLNPNSFERGGGAELCEAGIDNNNDGLADCQDSRCYFSGRTFYASPAGGGDGLSLASPFQIADFWPIAQAGDQLLLLDGEYKGAHSMIVPPSSLSGAECRPIMVKAVNEGKVTLNGESARTPVYLTSDYFEIVGVNAHHSNWTVFNIAGKFNVVRRAVGWDARDSNTNIFGVHYAEHTLLEDTAGFGIARKTYESSQHGDYTTIRRSWGRWERNTSLGLKMTYSCAYNNYNMRVENALGTWDHTSMPQTYEVMTYSGVPCYLDDWYRARFPECASQQGATMTGQTVQAPLAIFGMDHLDESKKTFSSIEGSIAYTKPGDMVAQLTGGFLATKLAEFTIRGSVSKMAHSIAPFYLRTPSNRAANYSYPLIWGHNAIVPAPFNGFFYAPLVGGVTGPEAESGAVKPSGKPQHWLW